MEDENRKTAKTILSQLPRLWAPMISGRAVIAERGVEITFKGSRKANVWCITLAGDDTYSVKIKKRTGGRFNNKTGFKSPIKEKSVLDVTGVYVEQLRSTFEDATGLFLSL